MIRRWLPWFVLGLVLIVALVAGTGGDGGPPSADDRVQRIASEVRCPTCESLSAAESDAPASEAVRDAIRARVDAGDSDAEIRAFLASRFGQDILLRPPASGIASLVWVLPVAGLVAGAAVLVAVVRRRRRITLATATPQDEAIVARAMGEGWA